jgi:hypothetical protein
MPEALLALPPALLAAVVLGAFTAMTTIGALSGFAAERLVPGRKIFAVPLV